MIDLTLDIATAPIGDSKTWKNKKIKWADFVRKLSTPYHTNETYKEFISFTKEEQGKIKDVGAYFGGYIRTGRRLKSNIMHRQLITLDIDFGYITLWEDFTLQYSCSAIIHSTHKHCEVSPRYRLIIPLDREVTPDEYTAISRKLAGNIDIDLFDGTTFDINRFMFWQSTPKDVEYYFEYQDGELLCADDVLAEYVDWTDISSHPRNKREDVGDRKRVEKAEDPLIKKGIIGAFCRTYPISDAIDEYLPEVYEKHDSERYTFIGGSTAGGAVTYDDKFLYSHHNTDPCSNRLVNAFDLVRLHLFEGESETKSLALMEEKALQDEEVKKTIAREKIQMADLDFENVDFDDLDKDAPDEDIKWMNTLEADKKGNYLPTAGNFTKIVKNDPRLKGMFMYNSFAQRVYVMRSLPWRMVYKPQPLRDVDFSGLRNYIERIYGITAPLKIEDALKIEAEKETFHPVREYLDKLKWDGTPRIHQMFQYWLGANDSEYTSLVALELTIGAVMRAYVAGSKFDTVVTFVGKGGAGKSTFAAKLGGEWFSDTLTTVHGKEGMEQIQGYWIIEMAELAGLRKSDIESQKAFVAKRKDVYRPSYGRTLEDFPRQCIFIATTNEKNFLKETAGNGNRRFPPILVDKDLALDHPFNMSKEEVNQIWAEAVSIYKSYGYNPLPDIEEHQQDFLDTDPRSGKVEMYLNTRVPIGWDDMAADERGFYFETSQTDAENTYLRTQISAVEVYVECFKGKEENFSRTDSKGIRDILINLGWEPCDTPRKLKAYGSQRIFKRTK